MLRELLDQLQPTEAENAGQGQIDFVRTQSDFMAQFAGDAVD